MQGKIIKGIAGFYYVYAEDGNTYECRAKGIFRKDKRKPLVGDNVDITVLDEKELEGSVTGIHKRRNSLIRPAVANVDQALVIFAMDNPKPNFMLLDRFLIMMEREAVPAVICFNKKDLATAEELEVLYETYSKTINIEALTMVDMAKKQYIPAVMEYTRTLADTVLAVKSAGADATVQTTVLKSISEKLAEAQAAETALEDKLAEAAGIEDPKKLAFFYKDVVHTAMDDLRTPVDELEMMVDKKVWPVPTYGDLIFEV